MKIIYLYHSLSAYGGIERVLTDKMNYLANIYNIDIYFITCDQKNDKFSYHLSPKIKYIDLNGMRYHDMYKYKYPYRLWFLYKFRKDYKKRLQNKVDLIKPDILITTTTFGATIIPKLKLKCKTIIESHLSFANILKAGEQHKNLNRFEYFLKSIYDWNLCRIIKKYNSLVVLTERDAKNWAPYKNAICIHNPVTNYPEKVTTCNNHSIICVGRLYSQKGYDLLIKAWSKIANKYPDWKINIYGDGNEKNEYLQLIIHYHLENSIFIHSAVTNIYEKYSDAEFLVLSSRSEGFVLVLVEAMSCGLPCVSFDCPYGPREIINDGVDGLLAKNGNIGDLADKIEWMITHEKERKEMGIKARESAKRFKQDVIMKQWINLFNELTEKNDQM
jgi:glycosyltransferase involved in cell wall biosynthesis